MKKKKEIAVILIVLLVFSLVGLFTYYRLQEIKQDLKICKGLGYDGIKFINSFSTEVECSNFSGLEEVKKRK